MTTDKHQTIVDAVSLVVIVGSALLVTIANLNNTYDDAFITYRYAYNFATGQGFVYNAGERFLGTTAPLFGLLVGGLGYLFGVDHIPLIGGWASGLSLMLIGSGLYLLGRLHKQRFCGFLAALLFVLHPANPLSFSGEMLLQMALTVWSFCVYKYGRTMLTSVLLALAILTRIDAVLAAAVLTLCYITERRRFPWREMLCMLGIVFPIALLSFFYYGSFLPASVNARIAQRDAQIAQAFWIGLYEWTKNFTVLGRSRILPAVAPELRFLAIGLAGSYAVLRCYRFWVPLLSWTVLFFLVYGIFGVPFYHWYMIPVILGLCIGAACGISYVLDSLIFIYNQVRLPHRIAGRPAIAYGLCLLILAPGLFAQMQQARKMSPFSPVERLYQNVGEWLSSHTPADKAVGYLEVGFMGYYAHRRFVDPVGLVNPGVADHVAQRDLIWAYRHYRPDYIIYNETFAGWQEHLLQEGWFRNEYRPIRKFLQTGYSAPLILYQRSVAAD